MSKENAKESKINPRGRIFTGTVTSSKMQKSARVEWDRKFPIKKYERYEKRRSSVIAHVPENIEVKEGDQVTIQECRPLSKTKNFIIIKNESN
jgi:small subunit ribosomal protein S17